MVGGWPKRMVVGIEASEGAASALRAAADLSKRTGSELHLVHAWQEYPLRLGRPRSAFSARAVEEHDDPYLRKAEQLVKRQARHLRQEGAEVAGGHLRRGRPAEEICKLAEEAGADLVVVGSRGLGTVKRLLVGSVSEEVVGTAPCPVLVVRGPWPPSRIVVGDDSSEQARQAGALAASIGRLFGASGQVVCAVPILPVRGGRRLLALYPRAYDAEARVPGHDVVARVEEVLEGRTAELEDVLGARPESRVVVGDAAAVIRNVARTAGKSTLVALGSRGLGSAKRAALGGVSTGVLRAVEGPVLVVPTSSTGPRWSTPRVRRGLARPIARRTDQTGMEREKEFPDEHLPDQDTSGLR
ncbi:MAG TPA: universal stress protein [Rubrobacter sp.]|nr:universal stress protein [Rubrobacter sp.]